MPFTHLIWVLSQSHNVHYLHNNELYWMHCIILLLLTFNALMVAFCGRASHVISKPWFSTDIDLLLQNLSLSGVHWLGAPKAWTPLSPSFKEHISQLINGLPESMVRVCQAKSIVVFDSRGNFLKFESKFINCCLRYCSFPKNCAESFMVNSCNL